ncbi:uncharacterized protein (TIGR02118 family) [Nocardioides ginsengisegetis]|uniref:Uncharacterized protein (TIGR02118 family) n=1 Tax=Nocardioides ginsengisegetis TaxID=661491 RepID=A0A7W3IZ27_9ACTN|nr:EthD family reductase [Nocardioides ginsengisegetis]MBA8803251.1 uncharacterized protein (TIGR02118 family) [Nocardioides ginsengisegetis]
MTHRLTIQYDTPADPEAFDKRYFEQHVPLVRPLPGLRGVSFSKPRGLGGVAPYLVAELDFDDANALKAALKSPEMAAVGADAETLPATRVMFTGEVVGAD